MWPNGVTKKVSAAVRILHQKRDASARAVHLMVKNDSLITYESGILGQAAGKKFFSATFLERKIMSTKTSFKRIALVAASALAIAGFSAVPSANATLTAPLIIDSTTSTVLTPTAPGGLAIAFGTATSATQPGFSFTAGVITNSVATVTVPAGSAVSIGLNSAVAFLATDDIVCSADGVAVVQINAAAARASGLLVIPAGVLATAGTKAISCTASDAVTPRPSLTVTMSLVVTALAAPSVTSTVFLGSGNGAGPATTDTLTPNGSRTVAAANSGFLSVTIRDTDNAITSNFTKVSATITDGPGYLVPDRAATSTASGCGTSGVRTASSTAAQVAGAVTHFTICADGTSGKSTIKIELQDSATPKITTTIATKTFEFFGSVSKLEIINPVGKIGLASGSGAQVLATAGVYTTSGNAYTNRAASTDVPAFIVKATDSSGRGVGNLTLGSTSSDSTVAATATCAGDDGTATFNSGGSGFYNCFWTTPANGKSGAKADLTVRIANPADTTGLTFLTAVLPVTLGGVIAKQTMALDSASYSAGAAAKLTVTSVDASGNPAADGQAVFGADATSNKQQGGALPTAAASFTVGGTFSTSANGFFAPAVSGDWSVLATGGDAAGASLSATATVEGDQSSSLALDAANAATDAANNAYDEAQNATQAASDALAAVSELAAQVTSLIAMVKKLTAAVAKMAKKK